ncbi:MAG: aminotransferase class IV [Afipia sp.]|nr:aminotransferase class IV [Afipia sp.]OJW66017.1 MAG: aminotransferase class IV [Afipia sp. 64-13]
MTQVWCNGRFLAADDVRIAISDRGFTLADGLFETLKAVGNEVLWFAEHMARLREGAQMLGLAIPYNDEVLKDAMIGLLHDQPSPESAIRLTLTRGPTAQRGLWSGDAPGEPTCLITVAAAGKTPPQRVIICRATRRNEHSPLSCLKSLNYGDNILARREAIGKGASDALMLNIRGDLACATVGNVFARIDGRWITPRIADGILPGIARAKIVRVLDVTERSIAETELMRADAAFISNSLGCALVRELEGRALDGDENLLPLSIYDDKGRSAGE